MTCEELRHKILAVTILARDCEHSLPSNIERIDQLEQYFLSCPVIVYENNSQDGTKALLQAWSERNPNVTAILEETNDTANDDFHIQVPFPDKSIARISKMVRLRNRLLDEAKKLPHIDYLLMLDIDIESFIPSQIVQALLSAPSYWGGLFANGASYMQYSDHVIRHFLQYDSYAYVDEGVDVMKSGQWVINHDYHVVTASRMTWKLNRHEFLPCYSAFNGLGIYRWEAIKGLRYDILQTPELKDKQACWCEHVPFNMGIVRQGYHNYIVRDIVVIYGYEHPKEYKGLSHWKNYHRAFHFFMHRPRQLFLVFFHMLKEHWGYSPYLRLQITENKS